MIPKIAHFIWFDDPSRKEADFDINVNIFRDLHPNWHIMYWGDDDLVRIGGSRWAANATASSFFRVELSKLIVLERFGGLTMDLDVQTLRNVDRLFENRGTFYTTWMENFTSFDFCIVASVKNNPVLKKASMDMARPISGRSIARTVFESAVFDHPRGNCVFWWPTIVGDMAKAGPDTYFYHRSAGTWRKHPFGSRRAEFGSI